MRKGIIGLSLLLTISLIPAYSATPPKAGSVCTKQGTTKTYQGKKFTCIKSGKKLVWNKGVIIKTPTPIPTPTPTPNPTPTLTPTPTLSNSPIPIPSPTPSASASPSVVFVDGDFDKGEGENLTQFWGDQAVFDEASVAFQFSGIHAKSYSIFLDSPRVGSFDWNSGLVREEAERITVFVTGLECDTVYQTEYKLFSDADGKELKQTWSAGGPRAIDCQLQRTGNTPIRKPIAKFPEGLQSISTVTSSRDSAMFRIHGIGFKSYRLELYSNLDGDRIWNSGVLSNALSAEKVEMRATGLPCGMYFNTRVELWTELDGRGRLLSDIKRHSFSTDQCGKKNIDTERILEVNGDCSSLGELTSANAKTLICRDTAFGRKYQEINLSESYVSPSLQNIQSENCLLKDTRKKTIASDNDMFGNAFPRDARWYPSTGLVNWAIIPIDFPDARGVGSPSDQHPKVVEEMDAWFKYFSRNRLNIKWTFPDIWIHIPQDSWKFDKYRNPIPFHELFVREQIFSIVDGQVDLTGVNAVFFILPKTLYGTNVYFHGGWNEIKLPSGKIISPWYWGGDDSNDYGKGLSWSAYWTHEIMHGIGFQGHAPGGLGWPVGIMSAQDKPILTVNSWEALLNGWSDSSNYLCIDSNDVVDISLKLQSLDVDYDGITSIMIKISDSKLLVIESRRPGVYSKFPDGFARLMAYVLDTSKPYNRFVRDLEGFEWEKNQFMYYLRVDQINSPDWIFDPSISSRGFALPGQTYTYAGLKIEFVSAGKYDSIRISKLS